MIYLFLVGILLHGAALAVVVSAVIIRQRRREAEICAAIKGYTIRSR